MYNLSKDILHMAKENKKGCFIK